MSALKRPVLCLFAPATVALVLGAGAWLGARLDPMARAGGRVFGPRALPDFVGQDQDGNTITAADLHGRVVIGDFIFTRCQGICPTLTSHMIALQRMISDPKTKFISVSLDPDYDTPPVLKDYARRWKGDPARWSLVALEDGTLNAMLAVIDGAFPQAPRDEAEAHTTRFFLVDERGLLRGAYAGADSLAIRQLAADAATLRR